MFLEIFLESVFEKLLLVVMPRRGEREMGNKGKESDFYYMRKKCFFYFVFVTKVSQKRNHVNFTK